MDRVDQLRAARNSPHVSFTEYIKLRARSKGLVFIFEGKQCPAAYVCWLRQLLQACVELGGQIIARSKKNVLALRKLIVKNPETANDKNLYFVDRDYDVEPKLGSFPDLYVTRGYSIENELIEWLTAESFIRAFFDIADSEDHEAVGFAKGRFDSVFRAYIEEAKELHRVVYICRTKGIECYPGDTVFSFIQIDWAAATVQRSYQSTDGLFEMLKIAQGEWRNIAAALSVADGFSDLDPVADWRGKFHFSVIRRFLIYLKEARLAGSAPFKRAAKLSADPAHPSLIGLLGSMTPCPACLTTFVKGFGVAADQACA